MKEGKPRLVVDLKLGLFFFFLVVIVFVFVSYSAINKGSSAKVLEPSSWNIFRKFTNLSLSALSSQQQNLSIQQNLTEQELSWQQDEKNKKLPVRVLCLIMTMSKDLETRARAVNETWVKRCDRHFFLLTSKEKRDDFITIDDIPDNRKNIVLKIRRAYEIIWEKYINEFDWILKADDDTYVVMENLKYFVSKLDPNKPGHLGYLFKKYLVSGYMSGGGGYVISNAGFRLMVERGLQKDNCSIPEEPDDPEHSEDVETGRCLEKVGVPVISSLDSEGRETFHPYPPNKHLVGPLSSYILNWGKNPVITGEGCCSRYSITFHYLSPSSIYQLEKIIYADRKNNISQIEQGIELSLDSVKVVSY